MEYSRPTPNTRLAIAVADRQAGTSPRKLIQGVLSGALSGACTGKDPRFLVSAQRRNRRFTGGLGRLASAKTIPARVRSFHEIGLPSTLRTGKRHNSSEMNSRGAFRCIIRCLHRKGPLRNNFARRRTRDSPPALVARHRRRRPAQVGRVPAIWLPSRSRTGKRAQLPGNEFKGCFPVHYPVLAPERTPPEYSRLPSVACRDSGRPRRLPSRSRQPHRPKHPGGPS
jgi:hypothetical protein